MELCIPQEGSFVYYIHKIFRKTNISYPLLRTWTCLYQGVKNVSFSENFANVINKLSLTWPSTKAYREPCQRSMTDILWENILQLSAVNYLRKTFHRRCFSVLNIPAQWRSFRVCNIKNKTKLYTHQIIHFSALSHAPRKHSTNHQ